MGEDKTKQDNPDVQNDAVIGVDLGRVEDPKDGVDPKQYEVNPRLASRQAAHMKELGPNYNEKKAARLKRDKFQQETVAKRRAADKAKRLEEEG